MVIHIMHMIRGIHLTTVTEEDIGEDTIMDIIMGIGMDIMPDYIMGHSTLITTTVMITIATIMDLVVVKEVRSILLAEFVQSVSYMPAILLIMTEIQEREEEQEKQHHSLILSIILNN